MPTDKPATSAASGQYFEAQPVSASKLRTVRLTAPGVELELATDSGVFSATQIDTGTELLIRTAPVLAAADGGNVLDLGCGYGPIALSLAQRLPRTTVWAVDVNARSVELCRLNALRMGLDNVRVAAPEDVPGDISFAAIYTNPPIRIGKAALHELLLQWLGRLEPTGRAWLVVQKHLGSDSLAKWLETQGFSVQRLLSRNSYRILEVVPT